MKQRMLLIEDNEQNRYLTTFLLQVRGWEVVSAVDGPTGLTLADTMTPPPVCCIRRAAACEHRKIDLALMSIC